MVRLVHEVQTFNTLDLPKFVRGKRGMWVSKYWQTITCLVVFIRQKSFDQ